MQICLRATCPIQVENGSTMVDGSQAPPSLRVLGSAGPGRASSCREGLGVFYEEGVLVLKAAPSAGNSSTSVIFLGGALGMAEVGPPGSSGPGLLRLPRRCRGWARAVCSSGQSCRCSESWALGSGLAGGGRTNGTIKGIWKEEGPSSVSAPLAVCNTVVRTKLTCTGPPTDGALWLSSCSIRTQGEARGGWHLAGTLKLQPARRGWTQGC